MHSIKDVRTIEFQQNGDDRGKLVVVENLKDIPFEMKRIFYIYGSDQEVVRGQHANRRTEFVLINVSGTSKVRVTDGRCEKVFVLDHPHMGVYLPSMIWKDMYDFSSDSVLLVVASEVYDPTEYIRDFDAYVKEVQGK